jgi:mRNA-degrading endonuclease RelE of RelBE toxin-antitoxin system
MKTIMAYRLIYSQTSREQISFLHPQIKPIVTAGIRKLKESPFQGKALERELSGYYSLETKRFRVIYDIDHQNHIIQIHYVGHRKDIYELFKEFLAKGSRKNNFTFWHRSFSPSTPEADLRL